MLTIKNIEALMDYIISMQNDDAIVSYLSACIAFLRNEPVTISLEIEYIE